MNNTINVKTDIFDVPDVLPSNCKYEPQLMRNIIHAIATTKSPVATICDTFGVSLSSVYWWRAINSDILRAWRAAMVARTHILVESIDEEGEKLDKDIADPLQDPRQQAVKIKHFDIRSKHKQWFASHVNRTDYGDSIEVENNINVTASDMRESAWQRSQGIEDAVYSEVSQVKQINRSLNKGTSSDE